MTDLQLHYRSLADVARAIKEKKLGSVELTASLLDRIAAVDTKLGSYVRVMREEAMAAARAADAAVSAGRPLGLLHGVPIAVKDLFWTQGVTTAAGMTIKQSFVPDEDCTVVSRLRSSGAVVLGKLKTTESAYADHHPTIPAPLNPWHDEYWAGVSSSGSGVATAAGLCFGSLGTDTGGSIRFPSAANGVTGLKPTWGRVSRHGVFELAATLDHVGPMTRSAEDAAHMLQVIAGRDPKDPTSSSYPVGDYVAALTRGVKGLRIGFDARWCRNQIDGMTGSVLDAALETVGKLGAVVVPIEFPDPTDVIADWFPLCGTEAAVVHEATYPALKSEYGPSMAGLIDLGRSTSGMDYQKIQLRRHAFRGNVQALFRNVDVLLVPASAVAAPTVERMGRMGEDAELIAGMLRFTCPFDMSGNPTVTLPGGFTPAGLPVAFQFVGDHFAEDVVLQAAAAFQSATNWHLRHPAL